MRQCRFSQKLERSNTFNLGTLQQPLAVIRKRIVNVARMSGKQLLYIAEVGLEFRKGQKMGSSSSSYQLKQGSYTFSLFFPFLFLLFLFALYQLLSVVSSPPAISLAAKCELSVLMR